MSESFPNLNQIEFAGTVAKCGFLLMAFIQLGIACGIIPVTIIWGGSFEELSPSLQLASVAAAVLLVFMTFVVNLRCSYATNHDLNTTVPPCWVSLSSWVVTAFMGLNTLGNLASSNPFERYGFGFLTAVLCICSWIVSSSRVQGGGNMEHETLA
mmetsp:Transcript_50897/g.75427  ORF Transcript_50897/g.75427 Transcript_50897/m.75427 type:complete len:155 (-) Transcript_50897:408-872(-)|eukprot:CAMPEP_0195508978 /NCGR_PEP_ID=MMETSP0794_2-20130614/2049_1 /TAXON_ID=515487 /ORGANISM="Stephanopyxis turris, Strain CCMP 815" /LENGTH=154 /DNA_ID=CAMNT_0040636083 /DNA_START=49 /DNA_END=513 /DNA_ORIENTATION=+